MTTTMEIWRYHRYDLEALLGDFVDDYDVDAIEDEVTWMDYATMNRYWRDIDEAEIVDIISKHELEL